MDLALLIAQSCATAFLAAWITAGVKDNIQHPATNRTFLAMVLQMDRMAELYPDDFERMKQRRITDPALQQTVLEYDAQGNLTKITDPDSTARQFEYDNSHHLIAEIDKRGGSLDAIESGFAKRTRDLPAGEHAKVL